LRLATDDDIAAAGVRLTDVASRLEQQVDQLLEYAEVEYEPLLEVEAAIERDAVLASQKA
jgi:hypothetical protein